MFDISRDERQNEAIAKVILNIQAGGIGGCLIHPTGFGKSTEAFKFIKKFNKNKLVHLVVPTIELQTQWRAKVHQVEHRVEVYVVNTYVSQPRTCSLLISDEGHRYANEDAKLFSKVLDNCTFDYNLTLTATLDKEQEAFLLRRNIPILDIITIEEAKSKKWISKNVTYNLGLKFTEEEEAKYITCTNIIKAHSPYFEGLNPFTALKDKEALKAYCAENGFDYDSMGMKITRHNIATQARKALVYGAASKILVIPEIIAKVNQQVILFSETKKYAETIHKSIINSVLYHSTISAKKKKEVLDKMKSGEAMLLCTAKALDEGLDIPALKVGITASGTSKERQSKQRDGRIGRYIEGEVATMINLYIKDTVEVGWLKKRQKSMNNIIWINSIDEILL